MTVKITIRDISEEVRDVLAARAAARRQSMQAYLRGELERLASRLSNAEWLKRVDDRKKASGVRLTVSEILEARDADRR